VTLFFVEQGKGSSGERDIITENREFMQVDKNNLFSGYITEYQRTASESILKQEFPGNHKATCYLLS